MISSAIRSSSRVAHRVAAGRDARQEAPRRPLAALHDAAATVAECWRIVALWRQRRRSRLDLKLLGPRDLQDLGISSCDAEAEAHKPFWRD